MRGADTITFLQAVGTTYTLSQTGDDDACLVGDLDVTGSLTITGNGPANTIIQAGTTATNGIDKVFALNPTGIANVSVTMTGMTVQNGRNTFAHTANFEDTGGGIDFFGAGTGTFTLTNSVVTNNSTLFHDGTDSGHYGGGIDIDSATPYTGAINITDTVISNNTASEQGGGINIFSDAAHVTLTHVTITGNQSLGSNGSPGDGGGISIRETGLAGGGSAIGFLTIQGNGNGNSLIDSNTANGVGGGISMPGNGEQTVTIKDATISNNTSHSNGGLASRGGGIFHDGTAATTTTLTHVTISNNHAPDFGSGGSRPRGRRPAGR